MGATDADAIIKRAVAIARECIGLTRVAIFLRDEVHGVMRGTWGTDLAGNTVDEHGITFDIWEGDLELYERKHASDGFWTVVENAPIVVHLPNETRVVRRGWLCCTPIRIGEEPLGMMYNDAGLTQARLDEEKQSKGAMLCARLGTALYLARKRGGAWTPPHRMASSPPILKATQMLMAEPALTAEELGWRVGLSASRMARIFKAEMGISLVEYRNRLRLRRFSELLDPSGDNLLDAAFEAGFGSYAQFHRVFVALRGTTPGKYARRGLARNDKKARRQ